MLFNGFLLYLSIYIQFEVAGAAYYCLHCTVQCSHRPAHARPQHGGLQRGAAGRATAALPRWAPPRLQHESGLCIPDCYFLQKCKLHYIRQASLSHPYYRKTVGFVKLHDDEMNNVSHVSLPVLKQFSSNVLGDCFLSNWRCLPFSPGRRIHLRPHF